MWLSQKRTWKRCNRCNSAVTCRRIFVARLTSQVIF